MANNTISKTLLQEWIADLSYTKKSLLKILQIHGDIIQSLYETKPELKEGEVCIETLLIKILTTSKSMLQLSEGTNINTLKHPNDLLFFDKSSFYILGRSIIESFLTLEYLFFNNLPEKEKEFRFQVWELSGYQARQNFGITTDPQKKLESEKTKISLLKSQITSSLFYQNLKKTDLWKLDKFGLPRIISWKKLLETSILNKEVFPLAYALYSNYAHSEYISIIQLQSTNNILNNSENLESLEMILKQLKMINAVCIKLFIEKFNFGMIVYEELDNSEKELISICDQLGRNKS